MKQAGLSLVEVMIAALLSVVIIQGFFQMFFSNLMSSNYHKTRSLAQSRASQAFFLLGNTIRTAGSGVILSGPDRYQILNNKSLTNATSSNTNHNFSLCKTRCDNSRTCTGFTWGSSTLASGSGKGMCRLGGSNMATSAAGGWVTYLKSVNTPFYTGTCGSFACTQEGTGNSSDSIAVVLDPQHNEDCVGQFVEGAVINRYFIAPDPEGKNGLHCQSYNYPDGGVKAPAQLLVEGIEQLQFLYGYADNGTSGVTSYRTASNIINWRYIRSVQIGVLAGGGNLWGDNKVLQSRRYNLLDSTTLTLTDKEPRYFYTMVQSLFAIEGDTSWREKRIFEVNQ